MRDLYSLLPGGSTRALAMLHNASPDRSRSPVHGRTLTRKPRFFRRQHHRQRRQQEAPAPPAHCALPGSWNKDLPQELAREVTLSPWFQWTPTSGPGGHHQLKTRLGIITHWRNGTAHIQGPSSQQLAGRILELREALKHETRVPTTDIPDIQAPVAHSVGDRADCVEPAPSTPGSIPAPRPLSPSSVHSRPRARSRQDFSVGSGQSIRKERESRSTTFSHSHVSFMPPEGDTSESRGFWFSWSSFWTLCYGVSCFWSICLTLWSLLCDLGPPVSTAVSALLSQRHWQPTRFSKKRPGPSQVPKRMQCLAKFGIAPRDILQEFF